MSGDTPAEVYRRAGELFDALLELDADARASALARAETEDPEAARLATAMLARDATTGALSQLDLVLDSSDPAGVLGSTVGPYVVEALLGHGGMGAVYLGRRANPEQRVAIKFVTLAAAPAAALERFRGEVSLLARLEHPGVVRYRDSGIDARGRPYLSMDFVDGEPLSCALPEIACDVERTVAVVVDVAEAVHHLHQRRVLHRDLKPSNVLVRREGDALVPIVIDLGIARALADPRTGADESLQRAMTGTLGLGPVGTPSFMSPEQAAGGADVDVRTDVHALGALLYALLTGHPPRGLDEPEAADPLEFQRRLRETEARAPSLAVDARVFGAAAAARRRRRIDRDLDAVVLKALASRPDERYGSAEALAVDLRRWLAGMPVDARLVGPIGRLRRLVRRRPLESAFVAVVALLLTFALVATLRSRAGEVLAQERFQDQLQVSRDLNRFYNEEVLARTSIDRDGPGVRAFELLRAAASSLDVRTNLHPSAEVATRGVLMHVFERMGESRAADAQLARALPLAEGLALNDPWRLQFTVYRGVVLLQRNQWSDAEALLRGVLEACAVTPDFDLDTELSAAQGLGFALLSTGDLEEARQWFEYALARFERVPVSSRVGGEEFYLELRGNLTYTKAVGGDLEGAVQDLQGLLTEVDDGRERPALVTLLASLASYETDLGRVESGLVHARRAVEVADRILEATHPDRISALHNLASVLNARGQVEEAIELERHVHEARLERFGRESEPVARALHNMSVFYFRLGRLEEARPLAVEALDTFVATVGDHHELTASACRTLGRIELGLGDAQAAFELYEQALATFEQLEGDHAADLAELRVLRADAASAAGR